MRNILGWIKKWESLKPDATFDPTAELAKLDAAETDNQGILAKYNHWVGHGTCFTERLENWKKDDGKYFNEETVKNYLSEIKDSLESVGRGLDPVEQNELDQITEYIKHGPPTPPEKRILPMDLKAALGVKTNVFSDLMKKWINYSWNIDFKVETSKIKELVNKVNGQGAKITTANLVKYCKEALAKKTELIDDTYDLPGANANNQDWLDWFFTRDPEIVVGTIALQELKADSNLKAQILDEMKKFKEDQKGLIRQDLSVYGNGKEFSEEGIIKYYYYAEKLGGQNHAKKHYYYEKPFEDNKQEGFWRMNNPSTWGAGIAILLLLASLGWAIWKRKLLAQWWNSPAELEEDDEDEDDD